MAVKVTKLSNIDLLHRAAQFTSGHESHMGLKTAYRNQHSIIRTQLFWVECTDIPLFVASQLVRSHVGVQCYQRSKRPDRGGADFADVCDFMVRNARTIGSTPAEDLAWLTKQIKTLPEQFDRYAPTDIAMLLNAEALMNMAHKRLCTKASEETRKVVQEIVEGVKECDPALAAHLVPACMYHGGICHEPNGCQLCKTEAGKAELEAYRNLFND